MATCTKQRATISQTLWNSSHALESTTTTTTRLLLTTDSSHYQWKNAIQWAYSSNTGTVNAFVITLYNVVLSQSAHTWIPGVSVSTPESLHRYSPADGVWFTDIIVGKVRTRGCLVNEWALLNRASVLMKKNYMTVCLGVWSLLTVALCRWFNVSWNLALSKPLECC